MNCGYKITAKGRELLAALLFAGEKLEITRVAVGSGRVEEGVDLADMTDLVQYVAEGTVTRCRHENNILHLAVQYSSNDTPGLDAFFLAEFIVQARDPETGKNVTLLYATLGDYVQPVKAYSETLPPDIRNYPLMLTVSDEIDVEVTAPAGLVTYRALMEEIQIVRSELEELIESAKTEGKNYIDDIVENAESKNLLDNSNFTNAVNQRGFNWYDTNPASPPQGCIDRWYLTDGDVYLNDEGLGVGLGSDHFTMFQRVKSGSALLGKPVTIAIQFAGFEPTVISCASFAEDTLLSNSESVAGSVSLEYLDGEVKFTIYCVLGKLVEWAALYEGEYTAETLPEYQPKSYSAELMECRRYLRVYEAGTLFTGYMNAAGKLYFTIPLTTAFRITPTAGTMYAKVHINGEEVTLSAVPIICDMDRNSVTLTFDAVDEALSAQPNKSLVLQLTDTFTLSAEL